MYITTAMRTLYMQSVSLIYKKINIVKPWTQFGLLRIGLSGELQSWLIKKKLKHQLNILNIWRHFLYVYILVQVSTMKILCFKFYCVLRNKIKCTWHCAAHVFTDGRYTELCVWGDAIYCPRDDRTGGEWIIQVLLQWQFLNKNVKRYLIICSSRLGVEGGYFLELLLHAVSCILYEEM